MNNILLNYLHTDLVNEVIKYIGENTYVIQCSNENCNDEDIFKYISNEDNFTYNCDVTKKLILCEKCIKNNRCAKCDSAKQSKKCFTPPF